MKKKKKSLFDFKDVIDLGDNRHCPPHHLPHKLPILHEPIIDEPCHTHKSIMHRMHHNFFCKFLKCPSYKYMMEKTKKIIKSNNHESMKTILIAGLGNPGKEYEKTRHNAGFMLADFFRDANRENFSGWEFSKKINGDISTGKINGKKIILLKPQTFMNLSGEAVSAAVKYYKVKTEDIIVLHDEIDLPLETFRFSKDSSAAGHKGVQAIIDTLGTQNFTRLRVGVDNRGEKKIETEKYVLGKFAETEMKTLKNIFLPASSDLRNYLDSPTK